MSKLFEQLTRTKARFATARGMISTEDLWDLPLTSVNGVSLDGIAKDLHETLGESTFSLTKSTKKDEETELKFEAVKYIFAVKTEEAKDARKATANKAEKAKLVDALAIKEGEELAGKSTKELKRAIKALED